MNAEVLTAAITGLVAGAAGSILAPWSQWGVEKRRLRRVERQQRITEWRQMIARYSEDIGVIKPLGLLSDSAYITLRPHLSAAIIKVLELSPTQIIVIGDAEGISASPEIHLLTKEIDHLERKWRL